MNLEKKSHAFRNFKLAQILIFQKPNHPTALKRQTQSNQPKLTNSNQPTQPKPIEPNIGKEVDLELCLQTCVKEVRMVCLSICQRVYTASIAVRKSLRRVPFLIMTNDVEALRTLRVNNERESERDAGQC